MRSVSIREQGRREVKSSSVSCIMLWKRDIVVPGRGRGPENWRNAFEEYRRRGEKGDLARVNGKEIYFSSTYL